uniref:Rho-GAP domain-containing protein n=1 Tax=Nothoprocta perdicaria TaxID=30464 RepID=A0A8C6ZGL6_NOTPE
QHRAAYEVRKEDESKRRNNLQHWLLFPGVSPPSCSPLLPALLPRHEFDSEQIPDLTKDTYIQDIHCVGSLCKLYFRELPNPLLTYQLYEKFSATAPYRGPSLCWCLLLPPSCSPWRRPRHGHRPRSTPPSWQTLCRANSTHNVLCFLPPEKGLPIR